MTKYSRLCTKSWEILKIMNHETQKLSSIRIFLNRFHHKRAEMAQIGRKMPYFDIISWKIRVFQYPWVKNQRYCECNFQPKNKGMSTQSKWDTLKFHNACITPIHFLPMLMSTQNRHCFLYDHFLWYFFLQNIINWKN